MTHGDGETSYKIPTTLIVIFVVLCMAIMGLVGFVVRRWWKSRGRVPIVVKSEYFFVIVTRSIAFGSRRRHFKKLLTVCH